MENAHRSSAKGRALEMEAQRIGETLAGLYRAGLMQQCEARIVAHALRLFEATPTPPPGWEPSPAKTALEQFGSRATNP